MCHVLFIHLSVDVYLICFYFRAIMNSAALNTGVQVFVWMCVFDSLRYIPKTENAGSYA